MSVFGLPEVQAASVIAPRAPFAGGSTIEKVSSQSSGSDPLRSTSIAASSSVVAEVSSAVGGVFGGGARPHSASVRPTATQASLVDAFSSDELP